MNVEEVRSYCLQFPHVTECTPFGDTTLVFKVYDKMFALLSLDEVPARLNLKCEPELALQLREQYAWVVGGYHQNKKHWNTILLGGQASSVLLRAWIEHSYRCVWDKLPKSVRER